MKLLPGQAVFVYLGVELCPGSAYYGGGKVPIAKFTGSL
jgi:hypothetical protein